MWKLIGENQFNFSLKVILVFKSFFITTPEPAIALRSSVPSNSMMPLFRDVHVENEIPDGGTLF